MSKQMAQVLKRQYILLSNRAHFDGEYGVNDEAYIRFLDRMIGTYGMPMMLILDIAA